ncbi:MAG: hypothetical protein AAF213_03045 [Pseudomonadota bacterium]
MEAPFFYLSKKNVVRIDLDVQEVDDAVSGLHSVTFVRPGKSLMGVSFDDLKTARRGTIEIDDKNQRARIKSVFSPSPVAATKPVFRM